MFGATPKDNPSPETKEESVIARGLSLTGDLSGNGTVRLDGHFNGTITCSELIIGSDGHLEGKVEADKVLVEGRLDGDVQAKTVTLTRSAKVIGNVHHQVLEVEAGATVEGRYSQTKPEKANIGTKLVAHQGKKQSPATATPLHPTGRTTDGDNARTASGNAGAAE